MLLHAVALMCLAAATAGPRAQTADSGTATGVGTISGRVKLTARIRSPLPSNVYPSRTIGKHAAPTIPEIRNVVVYLKDPAFRGVLRTTKSELLQEDETFIPLEKG